MASSGDNQRTWAFPLRPLCPTSGPGEGRFTVPSQVPRAPSPFQRGPGTFLVRPVLHPGDARQTEACPLAHGKLTDTLTSLSEQVSVLPAGALS